MIGAGQLARMTQQAAIPLGLSLRVLADTADDGAALVSHDVVVGDYHDLAVLREFARGCDVITFDHEHVPGAHLFALEAAGVTVHPRPAALRFAQDKQAMRERLTALGLPCPRWTPVSSGADLGAFGDDVGWPVVLKAATGGYDGRGVWVVDSLAGAADVLGSGIRLIAEERARIVRELAAVVARAPSGECRAWPVVETVQSDGICVEVLAPVADPGGAADLAMRIARELDVTGVLAVELFETPEGLLINELAMRPHNSGHWSIEGARTSQFEQHLRAVLDWPLGDTTPTAPVVVMTNLLGGPEGVRPAIDQRLQTCLGRWPDVKTHLYGKGFRPGRKVGHVTALGEDTDEVRTRARAAAAYLKEGDA
jgi:5-(carboxyamino)imidazole ribonucleotide synthase